MNDVKKSKIQSLKHFNLLLSSKESIKSSLNSKIVILKKSTLKLELFKVIKNIKYINSIILKITKDIFVKGCFL